MLPAFYLLPILIATVFLLIRAEIRKEKRLVYVFKPISTLLVIAVALLSILEPANNRVFTGGILIGLLLSLGGDVALMFQENRKYFSLGLGLFLLAHLAYTIVFSMLGRPSGWDILSAAILLTMAIGFYNMIRPNLGTMRLPVIIYIVVISVMVNRSVSTLAGPAFSMRQGILIVTGALLFYVSDILLAANRFWKPWRYNRISLAFYYAGQFLIALAASYFGS
jgi:uncharacterized membrane protein YhhN